MLADPRELDLPVESTPRFTSVRASASATLVAVKRVSTASSRSQCANTGSRLASPPARRRSGRPRRAATPDLSDEDLDSLVWDLEIDSAVAHGFDIHDDEDAAVAAQDIYREAFLAAVGRNLDALYRQKQQAHAAKYGCRSASTAASEGAPPGERPSHGREKFL